MRAAATVEPPVATTARLGTMTVDLRNRTVQSPDGARIALTSAEFVVLEIMLAANGEVVSRDCLSEAALRRPWRADDRSIDQLIFNLRHKLDADGQQLIHSVRGAGYMLCVTSPGPVRAADTPEGHADGNAGLSPMKIAAECP
jgi:DNA-binding response OmpR family regulator